MADPGILKRLRESVYGWNRFRGEHPDAVIDLRGAQLRGANLRGVDLHDANLRGAMLAEAYLPFADLSGANLQDVNLRAADLRSADLNTVDLRAANLRRADLSVSNLRVADLTGANLTGANLREANLSGADLHDARFHRTVLGSTDLSLARHLDTCHHVGGSVIDVETVKLSGNLPLAFLRGVGLSDDFIDYLPSLIGTAVEFYSCFVSYSHADKVFARRLHDELQGRGIRCWLDEHQVLPGDDIYEKVDSGIRLWDKVLLCCSEASLTSWWVDNEIDSAFAKERQLMQERGRKILSLIPLNLDDYLLSGAWKSGKERPVKSRMAADFTGWETDSAKFEQELARLVKALRADQDARLKPPASRL